MKKQRNKTLKLEEPNSQTVRFLSGLHVNLEEGKTSSVVTVTRTGTFRHPGYGKFEITKEMLQKILQNFDQRIYGQDIFYDVAHDPSAGAAGKITKLMVEGNRLRASVDWTPYGIDAIKNKGYSYSSIEFTENYTDNETEKEYGPLMMGAALCTRPFVKHLDPIELSETVPEGVFVLINPELETTLLQELIMWKKKLSEALFTALMALHLAEAVAKELTGAFDKAVEPLTDEAAGKALSDVFLASGKKLAEEVGSKEVKLSFDLGNIKTGLTENDVKELMAKETERAAGERIKLEEKLDGNKKILTDAINAATGLDDDIKKELGEAVLDLVTADMTEAQIKKLADTQIGMGNKLAAAKQLGERGFQWPKGNVHITVESGNQIKELQDIVDKRLGLDKMPDSQRFEKTEGKLQEVNKNYAEKVLSLYDEQNAHRLHAEHKSIKQLAGGDGLVSDVSVPASFERTVIREALYQMTGLSICDVNVEAFASVHNLPYSYRDTTAAGRTGIRKYEGQSIARAGVIQALEEARPIPQKIAFEISDELRYLTGNGQINWDVVNENMRNASRIVSEDSETLIYDEHLNAADQYASTAVSNEAVATADGTKTIFVLDNFPVVRPKVIYDLQGNQVGSTLYPVVIKSNSVVISEYDGTGTQSAGLYYSIDYNLGEISFVDEDGAASAPTSTHAIVASYTYTTNVYKFDTDLGSDADDVHWDKFLYRFGLRKVAVEDRQYMSNLALMSGTVRTNIEQARQFAANYARNGTNLDAEGNLGAIKGVPSWRAYAPGLAMGDQRVILGERRTVRFRVTKPWTMNQLENQKDSNGRYTGKKEAYGDQFVVVHTPSQLKAALTSMVLYSATTRVDRAS